MTKISSNIPININNLEESRFVLKKQGFNKYEILIIEKKDWDSEAENGRYITNLGKIIEVIKKGTFEEFSDKSQAAIINRLNAASQKHNSRFQNIQWLKIFVFPWILAKICNYTLFDIYETISINQKSESTSADKEIPDASNHSTSQLSALAREIENDFNNDLIHQAISKMNKADYIIDLGVKGKSDLLIKWGQIYFEKGEIDNAIKLNKELFVIIDTKIMEQIYVDWAQVCFNNHNYDDALKIISNVYFGNDSRDELSLNIIKELTKAEDLESVSIKIDEALGKITNFEKRTLCNTLLAREYFKRGNLDKALDYENRLFPKDSEPLIYEWAEHYLEKGELDAAYELYQKITSPKGAFSQKIAHEYFKNKNIGNALAIIWNITDIKTLENLFIAWIEEARKNNELENTTTIIENISIGENLIDPWVYKWAKEDFDNKKYDCAFALIKLLSRNYNKTGVNKLLFDLMSVHQKEETQLTEIIEFIIFKHIAKLKPKKTENEKQKFAKDIAKQKFQSTQNALQNNGDQTQVFDTIKEQVADDYGKVFN